MTKPKPLPDVKYLKECFEYNPDTGDLIWKERPEYHFGGSKIRKTRNLKNVGNVAGKINNVGYYSLTLDGSSFSNHRIIYKIMTGQDPGHLDINHINHVRSDNRWENLELCNRSHNVKCAISHHEISVRGENHPYSKLTEKDVVEIHNILSRGILSQAEIAEIYGVSRLTINAISTGRNWSWLHPSNS